MATDVTDKLAVLIDADNARPAIVDGLLAEVAKYGTAHVKRIYGDWTGPNLNGWKAALLDHSIQPIQQFAYTSGKNATDSAMIIDAMDLLYAERFDGFCIVSSDSDFTRLAMRLRESGKGVYGIGARKTPSAFQNACDRFTYLEVLEAEAEAEEPAAAVTKKSAAKAAKAPATKKAAAAKAPATKAGGATRTKATKAQLQELAALMLPAIEANAKDDGWASLGSVGQYVVNTNPTFDSRNYGYSKLSDLVRDVPRLEVREVPTGNGLVTLHVRRAPGGRSRR